MGFLSLFKQNQPSVSEANISEEEKKKKQNNGSVTISAGYAATQSAYQSTQEAALKYAKPETYTGNRLAYDSSAAKTNAKKRLFSGGAEVRDPYTGERLALTKQEAKALYGKDWIKHLAESDHVKPLERIYEDTKNNAWNTIDDIRNAANSADNLRVASRGFNNPKRSRTNKEYMQDEDYLRRKNVGVTEEGKRQAIIDGELAEQSINRQLRNSALKNVVKTGHEAGMKGAFDAGANAISLSGIMNIVAVIKGEKSGERALKDTLRDGGKAVASGYVMSSGLTVVSHTLSGSKSKFLQGLYNSKVPGKVITAVIATGDTLKRWGEGEITTQECLIELGDKGLNMMTMGYSMAVGQAMIPIPVIGGAVGALVGSMLTSSYYNNLICRLQTKQLEHRERQKIIAECRQVSEQAKAFRKELEIYLESYLQEYRECFDSALSSMRFSYQAGDADGVIASANDITRKLGGQVRYETVDEFKTFLDSDEDDIL